MLLSIGAVVSVIFYFKNEVFSFPLSQIKRAIAFGIITGITAWVGIILFKLFDKYIKPSKPKP
jgi:hypothetical protein